MPQSRTKLSWQLLIIVGFVVGLALWSPVKEHELPTDTPWHLLLQADGLDGPAPTLPDSLQQLDGQSIFLTGFMYPLEQSREQHRFLLSPYPPGCTFHVPPGPESMVEVLTEKSTRLTYDPIAVEGVFSLAGDEGGYHYQLQASTVKDWQ